MSGRKRFFTQNIDFNTNIAVIDGDEFVHAKTVQRVGVGDEIIMLDGSGKEYVAIVAAMQKNSLSAHIVGSANSDKEPQTDIYLLIGALKGDKTELVVQKACELGAKKVGVFNSEFCSAFINQNKLERLCKVAREAAKQCLRACAPEIEYFDNLNAALLSASDYKNKLFACEFAQNSDADILTLSGSTALVIGSEGGFSQKEAAMAKELGFSQICLGKRILRAETAAIALMSVVACAAGELN